MNVNDIINKIAETTPEELEQKGNRRSLLKGWGTKLAAAALPFGAATLNSTKASAQSKETIINALNYLLRLEFICEKLYREASELDGLVPAEFVTQFEQVKSQNFAHIDALKDTILTLGGNFESIEVSKIDLTGNRGDGGGPFSRALLETEDFLILMTVLCDTGVRVYKGMITEVFSDKQTVSLLMSIHSTRTRQSAFARFMRHYWIGVDTKPWITDNNSDTVNTAAQRAYAGEGKLRQAEIDLVGINGFDINVASATQAFDEPLNKLEGNNIIERFLDLR